MKKYLNIIFLVLSIVLTLVLGYQIYVGYMGNHTYYGDMVRIFTSEGSFNDTWKGVLVSVLFGLIPLLYMFLSKTKRLRNMIISVFIGLFLFSVSFISIKDGLIGGGLIMVLINFLIIFALGVYFISGISVLGSLIKKFFIKEEDSTIFDVFINFGIGLSIFNIINYVLILTTLFYPLISWIIFVGFGVLIYYKYSVFKNMISIVEKIFLGLTFDNLKKDYSYWFLFILILLSLMYYYFGFMHSYIPYPTAWDANHAYMFYPKMLSYNHGFYWSEVGMWGGSDIWTSYIAFWFNLFYPFENSFWISADTIAVEMNFLSGLFVLFFGLALIKEVLEYISLINKDTVSDKSTPFYIGWFLLILWLTSGMGAFLVFVDNKTDLGIMTLIILSIYSGFIFLRKSKEEEIFESQQPSGEIGFQLARNDSLLKYLGMSGFLYAVAVTAKPTALFDVVKFSLFLTWTWIGFFGMIGIFLVFLGLIGLMKFRGIGEYVSDSSSKIIAGIGVISVITDFIRTFMKKKLKYIIYILIWGAAFVITLCVIRLPFIITTNIKSGTFNATDIVKRVFLGYKQNTDIQSQPKLLLASVNDTVQIEKVFKEIGLNDTGIISQTTTGSANTLSGSSGINQIQFQSCSLSSAGLTSTGDLNKDLQTVIGDNFNEDVGRYIGFGWRSFTNPWWSFMIPGNNTCIGFDKTAVELCKNENDILSGNINNLKAVLGTLPQNSSGYVLLSNLINNTGSQDDAISQIKQFYQDRAIQIKGDIVSIPFRYLAPFNVTFNWSLQNLSSYYTDIGYIWLISLILIVLGVIYGILSFNRFLLGISLVTLMGWYLWSRIGGGIIWYDIGLIVWTILGTTVYFDALTKDKRYRIFYMTFIGIFVIFGFYQAVLNFARISSQGGSGPFMWYKQSNGKVYEITGSSLAQVENIKSPYRWGDVFELQFPHYNKFIDLANSRGADDGIFLAGTYARYFIRNQNHIVYDQFLNRLWEKFSDNDVCKSYLRLKESHIKYITIDPNIGTVVMGEGNKSLFDRFFAKIDEKENSISAHGVMSMLAQLYENGYLNYISSNNIGAVYGFRLTNDELRKHVPTNISDEDLTIIRASLSVARYPDINTLTQKYFNNQQGILLMIMNIMDERVSNGNFVYDMADILGKRVDNEKLQRLITLLLSNNIGSDAISYINQLNEDEKLVFLQYMSLYNMKDKNPTQYNQTLQKVLLDSIGASSQIIVLEVK